MIHARSRSFPRPALALLVLSGFFTGTVLAQDPATTTIPVATSTPETATSSPAALDTTDTTSATGTIQDIADTETAIAERRADIDDATAAITAETVSRSPVLSERQRTRFRNLAANTSNRLDATAERLDRITERTTERTNRFREQGYDTTSAERATAAARSAVDQATTTLGDIDAAVDQFVHSARPIETFAALRTVYASIFADLRDAKTALRIAVNELENASLPSSDPDTTPDA